MPPTKKPYTKETLLTLLGYACEEHVNTELPTLVLDAYKKELIDDDEFKAMGCCSVSTIKRYMYSIVDNRDVRDLIDKYVMACSSIFTAGSMVLNAFLAYCDAKGFLNNPEFIKSILDQTALKYIILPFKSELSGSSATCPIPEFVQFWKEYSAQLRPLYPPNDDLTFVSWDQPLNNLQQRIKTNFMTHVCYHFPSRFKKFVMMDILDTFPLEHKTVRVDGISRKVLATDDGHIIAYLNKLYNLIECGEQHLAYQDAAQVVAHEIPEDIELLVQEYRAHVDLEPKQKLSHFEKKININTVIRLLPFHIRMAKFFDSLQDTKKHSISPVNTYRRMYCYIDNRIIEDLVTRNNIRIVGSPTLENVFSLSHDAWRNCSNNARKLRRKKARKKKNRRRRGIGRLPRGNFRVDSISTDGVGIAVSMYTFPEDKSNTPTTSKETVDPPIYHIISCDTGRVNMFQSAQKDSSGRFVGTRLTASYYQRRAKILEHREWEKDRRSRNPEIVKVYDDMSKLTWKTPRLENFLDMVSCFVSNKHVLHAEHVVDKQHALWRMLLYRKKMSVMMRAVTRTIHKCALDRSVKIVFTVGNAKFESTGRRGAERERHGGVPTTSLAKLMVRTLKCLNVHYEYFEVDEHLSTRCCYKCGSRMHDVYDEAGKEVRELKRCSVCSERENTLKLRNRDANAAQNMWVITDHILRGLDRPDYLKRVRARRPRHPR